MIPSSTLVIGCSDQIPNELRAYHLMGDASTGAVLLTRYGATYSANASDVFAYPQLLETMLSSVLRNIPAPLRTRAREGAGPLARRVGRQPSGVSRDRRRDQSVHTARSQCAAASNNPFATSWSSIISNMPKQPTFEPWIAL